MVGSVGWAVGGGGGEAGVCARKISVVEAGGMLCSKVAIDSTFQIPDAQTFAVVWIAIVYREFD